MSMSTLLRRAAVKVRRMLAILARATASSQPEDIVGWGNNKLC
jgi:hypothetical protein